MSSRICATLAPLLLDERRARIDAAAASRLGGLRLLIENLHDPHNGAAVLRSAEAFGVQRVDVVESVERFRFSSTVTQGCEKWLDVVRHRTIGDAVATPARGRVRALRRRPGRRRRPMEDLDFARPAVVMVGNEHEGLGPEAVAAADVCFGLPMHGMTRSLNLSVAAALILERAATLRRAALGRAERPRRGADPGAARPLLRRVRAGRGRGARRPPRGAARSPPAQAAGRRRPRRLRSRRAATNRQTRAAVRSPAPVAVWVAPTGSSARNEIA